MHRSIFKKDAAPPASAGDTAPPGSTDADVPGNLQTSEHGQSVTASSNTVAAAIAPAPRFPAPPPVSSSVRMVDPVMMRQRSVDSDEEDLSEEPRSFSEAVAPPWPLHDNDGRPTGPPTMATILGAPAFAGVPTVWQPPSDLVTVTVPLDGKRQRSSGGHHGPIGFAGLKIPRHLMDLSPLAWSNFYDRRREVTIPGTDDVFVVYESGTPQPGKALFVLHHGGGLSAQSWAAAAKAMKPLANGGDGAILAYDCRGHGETRTSDDKDLSLETLSYDLVAILKTLYGNAMPDLFLAGHSMGGAVVTHVTSHKLLPKVCGLIVVDVVEGSAVEAIAGYDMLQFIHSRPRHFATIEDAVRWSLTSGTIRDVSSARVSMPLQLRPIDADGKRGFTWRVDLAATERFWPRWYAGLSGKFLSSPAARLLILAGPDRLDKPLMIGQMQAPRKVKERGFHFFFGVLSERPTLGKFQLNMQPACGHCVQEDAPQAIARVLVDFMHRNAPLDIAAIRQKALAARSPPKADDSKASST